MGMGMDALLNMVKDTVNKHAAAQSHTGFDPSALLGSLEGLFMQHAASNGMGGNTPRPASQDPYGDPGAQRNITSASQDPYGDPADEGPRR
jgi:hypothetical protein